MERSERHKRKESRESIGHEFAEHQQIIGTGSTRKQVRRFVFKAK